METLLINLDDIRAYRDIDRNFEEVRLQAFVRDIQRKNLSDFLGDALFYDVMNNPTSQQNIDLISGKKYKYNGNNIQFDGLKPMLVYWWLAKVSREGDQFLSNYGTAEYINNPQQSFQHTKNKEIIAQDHMSTANSYMNKCIQYLDSFKAIYTLWETKSEKKGTQFTMFKV